VAIDIIKLFEKYKIDYKTSGAETTKGWVNIACPFCGDDKRHLGYSERLDIWSCWRCGIKSKERVMKALLGTSQEKTAAILDEYYVAGKHDEERRIQAAELKLPENERTLLPAHRDYLIGRGFDPDELVRDHKIVSTGNYGDYKNRILIPIYYKGRLVSFHSRDVSGKSQKPKKACEQEKEVIRHKELLYNFDRVKGNTVIVSEGPFDAWRWRDLGVATFGIKFTEPQIDLLSCFKNIFVVFDSKMEDGEEKEVIAQKQAEELAERLAIWNNVYLISEIGCDPADLSQRRADRIASGFLEKIKKF
jgi:hypothetical protein